MAYDAELGLVFIPVIDSRFTYKNLETLEIEPGLRNLGVDRRDNPPGDALFLSVLQHKLISGRLLAWNPRAQKAAWQKRYPLAWNGGLLATAGGLVFQGTGDGAFHAHASRTANACGVSRPKPESSQHPSRTGPKASSTWPS